MFCSSKGLRIWRVFNSKNSANWKIRFLKSSGAGRPSHTSQPGCFFGYVWLLLPGPPSGRVTRSEFSGKREGPSPWQLSAHRCAAALQLQGFHITDCSETCEIDIPILQASVRIIQWLLEEPTFSNRAQICVSFPKNSTTDAYWTSDTVLRTFLVFIIKSSQPMSSTPLITHFVHGKKPRHGDTQ